MASTVTLVTKHHTGDQFKTDGTFNLGTYATGGITITAGQCDLTQLEDFIVISPGAYNYSPAIATGGTYVTVIPYYADYAATATGSLVEVATGTNLAGVSVRFVAHGK